jgi:hypothetical protein
MSEVTSSEIVRCDLCYELKKCVKRQWRPLIWQIENPKGTFQPIQHVCEECLTTAELCDFCQHLCKLGSFTTLLVKDFADGTEIELIICHGCYWGEGMLYPYIERKKERLSQV